MKKIKVLDLFSGAGGFSTGLEMTGKFETVLATDFNQAALNTFSKNHKSSQIVNGDITDPKIKNKIVELSTSKGIDMIIGGPPCQGFSMKGKKLGLNDPRNFLFLEYLDMVKRIHPKMFIIENVKPMITTADGFFIGEIKRLVNEMGYKISYAVLKASDYGVPQTRQRAIIIATEDKEISMPLPYKTNKVTVRDAISDLSYLNSNEGQEVSEYKTDANSKYQELMRKGSKELYNHKATNHSALALEKLALIPAEGDKKSLPEKYLGKQQFKTTWSRLIWDSQSPTIDTRFDTPSNGRNSHPYLNRAITPREAARLQSFPDKYRFYGNKTEITKQIGNAVPPLLAKAIGQNILKEFWNEYI